MEETQKDKQAESPVSPGFGALLREAREKAGFSLEDVSNRTKIGLNQLEAAEREELRFLPEPVYVRAFIRDIARAVGTDPAPIIAAYMQLVPGETVKTSEPSRTVPRRMMEKDVEFHASPRKRGLRALIAFAVIAALILSVWAGWSRGLNKTFSPGSTEAAQVSMQEASGRAAALQRPRSPSNAMPANAPLNARADGSVPPSPAVTQESPAAGSASAVQENASEQNAAGSAGRVTVRTIQGSWVKFVDADGRVLLQGSLGRGEERVLEGRLPIRATVGNALQCAVSLNGTAVDLSGFTRGSVARFVLK